MNTQNNTANNAGFNYKIFVSYHKPAELIKSDILTPIHVGRALAKNNPSYSWMKEHMIGDDTGDNISEKNPNYCELTAQYWAWKNCDADYIGFFHYRRHLNFNTDKNFQQNIFGLVEKELLNNDYIKDFKLDDYNIQNLIEQYDILTVQPWDVKNVGSKSNYDHYATSDKKLHIKDYEQALEILKNKYPDYIEDYKKYNEAEFGYYTNIFVMKKELFNNYCSWLFDILFELEKVSNISKYDMQEARIFGYISEWLFGIYIYHLKRTSHLKIKELERTIVNNADVIQKPNNINICFATDNNYAQHCGVAIASLLMNTKTSKAIDIYILNDGSLSRKNKKRLIALKKLYPKTTIYILKVEKELFQNLPIIEGSHFTEATYYRFIIPQLLDKINKIIYLDSDLIIKDDIENLYNINLNGNFIGAVQDIIGRDNQIRLNLNHKKYYCNAGVLILDLEKMRNNNISEKLFSWSKENSQKIKWQDQDVINVVLENDIFYLDLSWNYQHFPDSTQKDFTQEDEQKAEKNPKIIHYIGHIKPWDCRINRKFGYLYFYYLRYTPWKFKILKYTLKIILRYIKIIINNIFSIGNEYNKNKKHKVIKILGLKIKIA